MTYTRPESGAGYHAYASGSYKLSVGKLITRVQENAKTCVYSGYDAMSGSSYTCSFNPNLVSDYIDPWWKCDLGNTLNLANYFGAYYGDYTWYSQTLF